MNTATTSPARVRRLVSVFAALAMLVATPGAAPRAAESLADGSGKLSIEVNKGNLIRLGRPATTVFIANPEIADIDVKSPTLVYIFGKAPGETTLFAVDADENVVLDQSVVVTLNLTRLNGFLKEVDPQSTILARSIAGGIVLSGSVADVVSAANAERLARQFVPEDALIINQIQITGPNQVNLRVRVAEVSRSTLKRFGLNIDFLQTAGDIVFGVATGNVAGVAGVAGGTFATRNNGSFNMFGGVNGNSGDLNLLIDALETEGLISILAEPNLTAMSGETASFLAGGEFPIPVPQKDGTLTIEFKKFGVALSFTPTVLSGNRISMRVKPEVSSLSSVGAVTIQNIQIPALSVRRAETSVELASGQSFAIAGLLQSTSNNDIRKFPGLGDLPIIGMLFRSTEFQRNETELVIIVTPYIVRPVSVALAAPTDGLVQPSDTERLLNGDIYRQQPSAARSAPLGGTGARLIGPVGFELE